ncbi:autotransporter assembly complex protein TamB [Aeromonas sp. 82P]|uniref:autotransporter assembly complex protein TamB n=1 Tax=Aeromonas TaxID=642 RepID=UPI00191E4EA5|nr:translocation/assembly module TamB domain-containing protein [Aeromonas veronii]MBL0464000.1 translocation/assembly module TamB [Aeromonas veronii]MDD1845976.1 translocation/assembly module TamB [Aeromonas veronii]
MIWLKRIFLWLMGLVFLLLIGVSLLGFTHQGNKWLWQQARAALPSLKGELVAGQLGYGWTLEGAGWQDELVDVTVDRAVLDWDLGKLLQGKLWIKSLAVTHPVVKVADSEPAPEEPSEPFVWRPLPLKIQVDSLKVADLDLAVPGVAVTLGSLDIGATLNRKGLIVRGPVLDNLTVTLDDAAPASAAKSAKQPAANEKQAGAAVARNDKASAETAKQGKGAPAANTAKAAPILLPAIHLPFPIKLEGVSATRVQYKQGELIEGLDRLLLSATAADDRIEVRELSLRHAMADLALKGHIQLSDDYPLAVTLDAKARKGLLDGELQGEQATLALSGSVGKLGLALSAKGPVAASLKGSLAALDPALPFDVALDWKSLGWPLHKPAKDEPSYRLDKGSLTAKGKLSGYQFALNTSGKGTDVPPFKLALDGKGDLERLSKIALQLNALKGELKLDGKLAWNKGIEWQGTTLFKGINPAELLPELKGTLAGELESRFVMNEAGHWELKLPKLKVDGKLNQYPLALKGELSGNDKMEWQIPALSLQSGPNQLQAKGSISTAQWKLDANLQAPQLGGIYPGLKGDIKGQVKVSGNQQTPKIDADLASNRLYYAGTDLKGISLKGNAVIGAKPAGELALLVAQLKQGETKLSQLALNLSGDISQHLLTLTMKGDPVAANLKLGGGVRGDHWRGALSELRLKTPLRRWDLSSPWALDLDLPRQRLAMGDLCLGSQGASLCVKGSQVSAAQGTLEFALSEFDLKRLRPWLPDNFRWQAMLSADGRASWRGNQPTLHAVVRTTPGTFVADGLKTDYQQLALALDFERQQAAIRLDFASKQIGNIDTDLLIREPAGRGLLGGQLKFDDLKLNTFAPLIPEVRSLQGIISADARFDGTLAAPLLFGQLNLRDGEVQTHSDMVTLTKLVTHLKIEGNRAELDGSMLVGKGPLALGGWLSWAKMPVSGSLTIQGKDLEAQYPGMGRVRVSPDIAVSLGEETRITGQVDIPWARILVKSLPDSAVAVSDDVTVVYDDLPPVTKQASLPLAMKVAIRLGNDVKLDAMGLKTDVSGGLNIRQDPEKPLAGNGQLVLTNGRFKAYGQNLIIKEGRILFSGPLDRPFLNIEANRDPDTIEGQVTVGVRVTGPASKPEITVYSEPQMAQSEQLSYLLRGKGLQTNGEDGGFNGLLVAGAVNQANGVVSSIGESLGMSDVSLDTAGSGDNTQVTLSAYLLPGLQFQYGVGVFSPIAEFKLRYEVLPRLYLQAMSGVAQAVDIFYRFTL